MKIWDIYQVHWKKNGTLVRPIYDILYNFITPKEVFNVRRKIIEISPLGYMRGRTLKLLIVG